MATPSQIREWLRKMQYPNPNVSDEALQTLCRGAMGPIFQQIIDRVKPRQEIEHTKKAVLVNKLMQNEKSRFGFSKCHDEADIEKLRLYNEKRKLEKQLQEINAQNIEDEASLEHLKAKIKSKNAKFQINKEKLRDSEKDIVLFKAKIDSLLEQKESCLKLHEQSKVLEKTNPVDIEVVPEKITEVTSKLCDIISSYNPQLSPTTPDLTTISENSNVGSLQTSVIISSNKKPLSAIKRTKRLNSSRTLAEITNNYSLISSTMRKRNLSFVPKFNSTLSPSTSLIIDKNIESIKELEQLCWSNQSVMKLVNEIWESDCENVFKLLFEMKIKHKNKIAALIAQNNGCKDNLKSLVGMEKLYAFHVETEMKRMICKQEQIKIQKMLANINLKEDIPNLMVLKATEFSLQNGIDCARKNITKLQEDMPDNSEKLNKIFEEIQRVQSESLSVKSKIETNLCILRDFSSWLDKQHKSIFENIKKPQLYSEYELFNSDVAEQDAQSFVACPFQSQNTNYLNNWVKIYNNPELLELIQCPYLSPENTIKFYFEQKDWLNQLQALQKETTNEKLNTSMAQVIITYDEKKVSDSSKKSVELLKASAFSCSEILKRLNELDTELKYYLESPLNECVAPNEKFINKSLKEYTELFDSYYKQLL